VTRGRRAQRYAFFMRTAVVLLAFALASFARAEDARFCSPSGEYCVVMRANPMRAAVYRNAELRHVFALESAGSPLVSDQGYVVTYENVRCDKNAKLLTIRSSGGAIVRTLNVTDVFTRHDQLWLCRGENEVRWSMGYALQATVLVTNTEWKDPLSLFETIDVDVASGDVPSPIRDLCPDALRIEASPDAFLASAIHRVTPEYPEVASKARIMGVVEAEVTVGRSGEVESVTITKPMPFGLDEAVRTALWQWTFAPQPAPTTGRIAFRFEILRSAVIRPVVTHCNAR